MYLNSSTKIFFVIVSILARFVCYLAIMPVGHQYEPEASLVVSLAKRGHHLAFDKLVASEASRAEVRLVACRAIVILREEKRM
jgi:hypothetical protein